MKLIRRLINHLRTRLKKAPEIDTHKQYTPIIPVPEALKGKNIILVPMHASHAE